MEIKRDYYLDKLTKRKNNGLIKVITGIKRCGKSYLLNTIFYNYLLENGVDPEKFMSVYQGDKYIRDILKRNKVKNQGELEESLQEQLRNTLIILRILS